MPMPRPISARTASPHPGAKPTLSTPPPPSQARAAAVVVEQVAEGCDFEDAVAAGRAVKESLVNVVVTVGEVQMSTLVEVSATYIICSCD